MKNLSGTTYTYDYTGVFPLHYCGLSRCSICGACFFCYNHDTCVPISIPEVNVSYKFVTTSNVIALKCSDCKKCNNCCDCNKCPDCGVKMESNIPPESDKADE